MYIGPTSAPTLLSGAFTSAFIGLVTVRHLAKRRMPLNYIITIKHSEDRQRGPCRPQLAFAALQHQLLRFLKGARRPF
jgi:hypothetical protein